MSKGSAEPTTEHKVVLFDVPLSIVQAIEEDMGVDYIDVVMRASGSRATYMRMVCEVARRTLDGEAKELFRVPDDVGLDELAARFNRLEVTASRPLADAASGATASD